MFILLVILYLRHGRQGYKMYNLSYVCFNGRRTPYLNKKNFEGNLKFCHLALGRGKCQISNNAS